MHRCTAAPWAGTSGPGVAPWASAPGGFVGGPELLGPVHRRQPFAESEDVQLGAASRVKACRSPGSPALTLNPSRRGGKPDSQSDNPGWASEAAPSEVPGQQLRRRSPGSPGKVPQLRASVQAPASSFRRRGNSHGPPGSGRSTLGSEAAAWASAPGGFVAGPDGPASRSPGSPVAAGLASRIVNLTFRFLKPGSCQDEPTRPCRPRLPLPGAASMPEESEGVQLRAASRASVQAAAGPGSPGPPAASGRTKAKIRRLLDFSLVESGAC